jgi:hypothetical protein
MKNKLFTRDFYIDEERSSLHGKLFTPDKTLAGARLKTTDEYKIFGYVRQLFQISSEMGMKGPKIGNLTFNDGDLYGEIRIEEGFEYFKNGSITEFTLEEYFGTIPPRIGNSSNKGSRYEAFKRVSGLYFNNYYLDIHGGSTEGNKNEHGEAHVHIISNNSRKEIGKLYFPKYEEWKLSDKKIELLKTEGPQVPQKMKKEIVEWLDKNDCSNLKELNRIWTDMNKFNNRVK